MSYHFMSGDVIFKTKRAMKQFVEILESDEMITEDGCLYLEGSNYSGQNALNEESLILDIPFDLYRGMYEEIIEIISSLPLSTQSQITFSGRKVDFSSMSYIEFNNLEVTELDFKKGVKKALGSNFDHPYHSFLENGDSSHQFDVAMRML